MDGLSPITHVLWMHGQDLTSLEHSKYTSILFINRILGMDAYVRSLFVPAHSINSSVYVRTQCYGMFIIKRFVLVRCISLIKRSKVLQKSVRYYIRFHERV